MADNESPNLVRFAGDVVVEKVVITSLISNKFFSITNQLLTIQIYEDIYSPFISGSLIIRESLDFAENLPLIGEEVLDIKIYTPTLNELPNNAGVIEGRFYIYKMSDKFEAAERNLIYKLDFISLDAISDANVKISKGFQGKVSDIALKVLNDEDNLATKKNVFVEESANSIKYVSNFWSPMRNLAYLAERGISSSNTPTYMFFENRTGYKFVSLDFMNANVVQQTFNYDNSHQVVDPLGGSSKKIMQDYSRILELNSPEPYNFLDRLNSGTFGSSMIYSDLTTKKYYDLRYSFQDDWAITDQERLNKYSAYSKNVFSTSRAVVMNDTVQTYAYTDFAQSNNVTTIQRRVSRLKQAAAHKLDIVVSGRTDYTVGQVVIVQTYQQEPMWESDDPGQKKQKFITGKYLISAIKHNINREMHECQLELIKDSGVVDLDRGNENRYA